MCTRHISDSMSDKKRCPNPTMDIKQLFQKLPVFLKKEVLQGVVDLITTAYWETCPHCPHCESPVEEKNCYYCDGSAEREVLEEEEKVDQEMGFEEEAYLS